jgi:hypothetical protein
MKAILALVAVAIVLTAVGGAGWITCAIAEWDAARIVFQWILVGACAVTFAALAVALVVGLYHLYLHLFTARRPVSLFASVDRADPDEES